MAFTPFSILRSPSVQAILRPQVSTPTPAPELPPAPSAFFRHTFSAASMLTTTDPLPTPSPSPLPVSSSPAPPARSPLPPPNLCTAIVPISLPRDITTYIPIPTPLCLEIIPISPVSDLTPALAPLLTFDSVRQSSKILLSGGAPTPFSSIFEALSTTIHRDTLAAPLVEAVASPLRDSMTQFPYTMATNHREFLNRAGIPVSQFGTKSHPHPVHKTIEINLLHNVWKHYATSPASVLFMKPSKFSKLQRENPNFTELHNYRLTPKDTVRYPETSHTLPRTHTVFMHDALMYYTPGQILNLFASAPEIQQLYASLVVPPESSFTDISLNPSLYKFRFENDQLVYHLEDNPAHSYTQPRSALQWLQTTTIQDSSLVLSVSILDSWGPVHSLLIQRGLPPSCPTHDTASFRAPDAILLPEPNSLRLDARHRLVPSEVYHSLFAYTRAVRTLRVTDPAGFIRTQSNKAEHSWVTSAAWDNLQHFALHTAPHRPVAHFMLFRSPLQRLRHWAKTNEFLLFCASALLSAPAAFILARTTLSIATSQIRSLAVFHRWIVPPPSWFPLLLRQAPLLELTLQPQFAPFLPTFLSKFEPLLPRCIRAFWPASPPRWLIPSALCVASIPIFLLAVRWFVGPDTPQALHDQYLAYFHPKPWTLTLARSPVTCQQSPFLPFDSLPPQPEALNLPSIAEPSSALTLPPPPDRTPIGPPLETYLPPPPPADPLTAPETSAAPTPTPVDPPQPRPTTPPPPPATTFAPQTPHVNPKLIPLTEPEPENPSALLADSSATGPVLPWSAIVPREYLSNCGDFLTRERCIPASDLPLPKGRDCLLEAVSRATGIHPDALWRTLTSHLPDSFFNPDTIQRFGLNTDHFTVLASIYDLKATFKTTDGVFDIGVANAPTTFTIDHTPETRHAPGHFQLSSDSAPPKLNGAKTADLSHIATSFRCEGSLLPFKRVHTYTANLRRAKNLISNLKNGFDGVLHNVNPNHPNSAREQFLSLDHQMDIAAPRQIHLIHIAGFAGCGKSYPIQQLLQHNAFRSSRVAVPTTELRAEWKSAMNLNASQAWRVSTWESSLLKRSRTLVIDEVYKMPRGYLDLSILADPTLEFVIVLGDPLQGEYHSTHPSSSNHRVASEIDHLRPYIDFYCFWSRRIPKDVASFFMVPTLNDAPGHRSFVQSPPEGYPVLACSQNQAQTLTQCGFKAVTVASSQGSTYSSLVTIHLDRNSKLLSHAHSLVALTRSRKGYFFCGDKTQLGAGGNFLFTEYFAGRAVDARKTFHRQLANLELILEPITSRRPKFSGSASHLSHHSLAELLKPTVSSRHITQFNSGHVNLPDPIIPGVLSRHSTLASTHRADVVLDQDQVISPYDDDAERVSCHFVPETRRPLHLDLPSASVSATAPSEDQISAPNPEPVYPGEHFETVASTFAPAFDPEAKEILFRGQPSCQFPFINQPFKLSALPSSCLAAVHRSKSDPTLLPASIPKRLRFRHSDAPYQISAKDELLGSLLFNALCRAYHISPFLSLPFDEALFIECINANEFAQLTSKTQATIMANAFRSDPDWRWSAVRIFAKTQHKVNEASILGDWKACQTLALMHDAVILLLGPVKKYQRAVFSRYRPSSIYIHASHTPFDLSSWCQAHLTDSEHVTNDYTAYDQSQHGEAVVLEVKKMRFAGIPEHLIQLHVHLKTRVSTQFGPLTCMRLTGEPGTYDDNTEYNIGVIFLQYAITTEAVMVSGDDSLIDSLPPTRFDWPLVSQLLSLRFKTEVGKYSLFCGYYVGPAGAVRSPTALFVKVLQALDDDSIADKMASYLTEFSVGHSLGQPMWNLLPLRSVIHQSALFDFFCRACPRDWKVALRIGNPDPSIFEPILSAVSWASNPVFAMLSFAQRRLLLSSRLGLSSSTMPISNPNEGELLQESQSAPPTSSSPQFSHIEAFLSQHPSASFHQPRPLLSGAGSMESLSALIPLLTELLSHLNTNESAPSSDPVAPDVLPGGSSASRLVRPPKLQAPARSLTSSSFLKGPSIQLPFQFIYYDITGVEKGTNSIDISGKDILLTMMKPYSHARLTSLEAVVFPYSASLTYPQTFDAVWSTADAVISGSDIISTYGSQRVTFGGPISSSVQITIPADLTTLNPIIRDSVTYKDTPKLNVAFYQNPDNVALGVSKAVICGSVVIRGVLEVSSVRPSPSKA